MDCFGKNPGEGAFWPAAPSNQFNSLIVPLNVGVKLG